jgi:hypothetical protein
LLPLLSWGAAPAPRQQTAPRAGVEVVDLRAATAVHTHVAVPATTHAPRPRRDGVPFAVLGVALLAVSALVARASRVAILPRVACPWTRPAARAPPFLPLPR